MTKLAAALAVVAALAVGTATATADVRKGKLYLNGAIVGTVITPNDLPIEGTDPFYRVTNGVPGQLAIAGVGPGEVGYHGGNWAVYRVTFVSGVTPYLLTSDKAVATALAAGDVTVTRAPASDFLCPVTADP